MSVCTRCSIDKPDRDYRHKTSGPRTGFRFPVCAQCEAERIAVRAANDLRANGYTAEATDPAVKQREDDDPSSAISRSEIAR